MTSNVPQGDATDGGPNSETSGEIPAAREDSEGETAVTSLDDPATLRDRDAVTYSERTYAHEEPDHCEAAAAGRAIVGVTNGEGEVLLLVRDGADRVILPNCVVEPGEDWAAAARRAVEETTGGAVELRGVERLRQVTHEVDADGEYHHQNTTHHVVFRGSPVADGAERDDPAVTDDSGWEARWCDGLPVDPDEEGDAIDDVREFLG